MEQPSSQERTLTTRDLRDLHHRVVQELLCGQNFLVLYAGRPLARILSLRPVPIALPVPDLQGQTSHMERLEFLLGQTDLVRVLGLTLTTFLIRRPGMQFFQSTLDRLEALAGIIDDLEPALPPNRIKPWFLRASGELSGVSVLSALASPWRPGDATITLVEQLARRERIRSLTSPIPPFSRRRP